MYLGAPCGHSFFDIIQVLRLHTASLTGSVFRVCSAGCSSRSVVSSIHSQKMVLQATPVLVSTLALYIILFFIWILNTSAPQPMLFIAECIMYYCNTRFREF